jgi:hypothetical protein
MVTKFERIIGMKLATLYFVTQAQLRCSIKLNVRSVLIKCERSLIKLHGNKPETFSNLRNSIDTTHLSFSTALEKHLFSSHSLFLRDRLEVGRQIEDRSKK